MKYREVPLAELTLRKYEKPFRLSGRELVRKLCLSLGLLQLGDSRDVVVDVFLALLKASEPVSLAGIEKSVKLSRKAHKLPLSGVASSNVRRQVRRLKDCFVVEKVGNGYRISENAPLHELFAEKIEKFYLPMIVSRVKEYCEAVERERWKHGSSVSEMQKSND
ncbi:hypothetical protein KY319_00345 [Candidatus Woesearchaeota archaeon]|nr:hypothetical protein [Candidatus Woesearchaeota archaeon]